MTNRNLILITLIVVAAFSRLIPHPWNFTAVGAMALFAGAHFRQTWVAVLAPLAALLLSDLVFGFYPSIVFVYGAFVLTTLVGRYLQDKISGRRVAGASLVASILFFALSNFGVWAMDGMYARTFEGLVQCYVMAIPFLFNQVAGDLFYSGVLFGAYALAQNFVLAKSSASQQL